MSASATSPSQNQAGLFAANGRLVPVVASLFGIITAGLLAICFLSALHRRKLRMIANDPRTIALVRERARIQEELERGPPKPMTKTVNVEIDLETGEGQQEWRTVMPLSLEFTPDSLTPPPPYVPSKNGQATPPKQEDEAKYVRLTVLVTLPSASGRHHRKDDVILDATLADSQGRPLGPVDTVQHSEYYEFPQAAFGIYRERYTGEAL